MNPVLETVLSNSAVVALLAILLLPLGRFCRKPALMHCLWVLVLIKLVTPPIVRLPFVIPELSRERPLEVRAVERTPRSEVADSPVSEALTAETVDVEFKREFIEDEVGFETSEDEIGGFEADSLVAEVDTSAVLSNLGVQTESPIAERNTAAEIEPGRIEVAESSSSTGIASFASQVGRWLTQVTVLLLATWLIGSMFWYVRTALRIRRFNGLLKLASPAPESLQREIEGLLRSCGLKRSPSVLVVPGSVSPMLWSFGWRTRLLIPEELLKRLPAESRQSLLLHELAHFHRGDHWVRILEFLISGLFWWHPAVWLALREIEKAEEQCCDGWVVSRLPNGPRPYADAIMETLDFLAEQPCCLPPLASGIGRVAFMKQRLTLIMSGSPTKTLTGRSRLLVSVWALLLLSMLPTLGATNNDPAADATKSNAEKQPAGSSVAEENRGAQPIGRGIVADLLQSDNEPTVFETKPRSFLDKLDRNWRLAISPDGKRIAVSYSGKPSPGRVRLFDIESQEEIAQFEETMGIPSVGFSPDGRWLIYGRWDSVVKILNAETFEVAAVLDIGWAGGSRFAVSPDGKLLATLAEGQPDAEGILRGQVKLWEMPTGKFIAQLNGDMFRFHDVCFSPDGKQLAVGGGQWKGNQMGQVNLWDVKTRKHVKSLKGHSQAVLSVMFSPDGETIATGSRDNTVRLWNRADGSAKATLRGHTSTVERTVFSPDGKLLATTAWDGTAKLWRLADSTLQATLSGHTRLVHTAEFTPDGKTLATACEDGIVRLWDVTTGQQTAALEREYAGQDDPEAILAVAWSSDGTMIASAHEDKTVRLRDVELGEVIRILDGHDDVVSNLAFSPNGATLATASYDHNVKLWNVATGEELKTLSGHTNWVFSVAFSPDGKRLASSGYDKTVRLWHVESGSEQAKLRGHLATVRAVAFSPDGKLLASGSGDRTVRIWDMESLKELATLSGHKGNVRTVRFSPDGKTIASGSEDRTLKLWDVESRKERATLSGHAGMVWSLAFSPQGKTLASGGFDNAIKLWNPQSGALRKTLSGHTDVVTSLAFAPDTRALISGSYDKSLKLWKAKQPTIPPVAVMAAHEDQVRFVAFSPDGRKMATGGHDRLVKLWDLATGKVLHEMTHERRVTCGAFSADGTTLATGGADLLIRLWDSDSGKPVSTLPGHDGVVMKISFSPDGTKLASSGSDRTVKLWDVKAKKTIWALPEQPLPVTCVSFSPDGSRLATTTGDWQRQSVTGELKLWDAASGKELANLRGHAGKITRVRFSPDGKTLASSGKDRTVRIWDLGTYAERASLLHQGQVECVTFLPGGKTLAAGLGSGKGSVLLWDLQSKRMVRSFEGHDITVYSLAASRDGTLLASASRDGTVKLWPLTKGSELLHIEAGSYVFKVANSPDGRRLLTGGNTAPRLWDLEDGQLIRNFEGQTGKSIGVAFSPDGKRALSGGDTKTVFLWDVETGQILRRLEGHTNHIRTVAFSPDGQTALSAGLDKVAIHWDLATGRALHRFDGHQNAIQWISFSPDGKTAVTAGVGTTRLWSVETGDEIRRFPTGATGVLVACAVFSPDGQRLLTATTNGIVSLWDIATGDRLRRFNSSSPNMQAVAFSPDGRYAVAGGTERRLLVWDIEKEKPIGQIGRHGTAKLARNAVKGIVFTPDGRRVISGGGDGCARLWQFNPESQPTTADLVRRWEDGS